MIQRRDFLKTAAAASALALPNIARGQGAKLLRFVPQANLSSLDAVAGTQYVVRNAAFLIWDTLYGVDSQLTPKPQMCEGHTVDAALKTWTFKLRPGLKFHDGEKVTSKDVVASLNRWMVRDTMGQIIKTRLDALEALDDLTFRFRLNQPFAKMLFALGKNNAPVAFIMPERIANTDPFKLISEYVGSGPMRFRQDQWVPGAEAVFERFADYSVRPEPGDWLAGGKKMYFDRIEWKIMPDAATAGAALQSGEVDWWETPIADLVPLLKKNKNISVDIADPFGNIGALRMNHLQPPFNDVRARRAMALLVDQKDYLSAAFTTDATWWRECFAWLGCGTENGSEVGSEPYRKPNPAEAKRLLAEAGYKGEKIVILTTQEIPLIDGLAQVTADKLRAIGVNVDVQASDWGTLVVRRAKKDPVEKGGWSIFQSGGDIATLAQPATNILIDARCDQNNYVGWPCSDRLETLRTALIEAPSGPKFIEYNKALWDELPSILLGQFKQPVAYRSTVSGL